MLQPEKLVETLGEDEGGSSPLCVAADAAGTQVTGWAGAALAGSKVNTLEILSLPHFLQD